MSIMDFEQDEKIEKLEKKIKRLDKKQNGGEPVSKIISELVGKDCVIDGSDVYDEKCKVEDFDGVWIKLLVYGKKENKTLVVPIDSIEKFEIVQ